MAEPLKDFSSTDVQGALKVLKDEIEKSTLTDCSGFLEVFAASNSGSGRSS
jgi:hypothetical protein